MQNTHKLALLLLLPLTACVSPPTLVASTCPPPPPLPLVLTSSVSTGKSIAERWEKVLDDFEDELAALQTKAQRAP